MTMKDGICPHCNSTQVCYKHDESGHSISIDWKNGFRPYIFVCTDCGYMAQFVHRKHLDNIRNKWANVQDDIIQQTQNYEYELEKLSHENDGLFSIEKPKRKPKRKHKNDEG